MEELRTELHDMSEKIFQLQEKTEHLTNGQRYAAINEIEKNIAPLRKDLRSLEYELYNQQHDDEEIKSQINTILNQINELEDLKSDLNQRINTENEHTRQELNNKIINFMRDELDPIKQSVQDNQENMQEIKKDLTNLRLEMIENEKNRQIQEAAKYDKFKWIVTGVAGVAGGLGTLFIFLQPAIKVLLNIFLP